MKHLIYLRKLLLLYICAGLLQVITVILIEYIATFNRHDSLNGLQEAGAFALVIILAIVLVMILLATLPVAIYNWVETGRLRYTIHRYIYKASVALVAFAGAIDLYLILNTLNGINRY